MSYLLVPLQVSSSTASVWIGATGEPERELVLVATPGQTEVGLSGGWQHWEARPGGPSVDVQRPTLEELQPRTRYVLELHGDNQVLASGSVTTLPDRLPMPGEPPFTVMLGSCFYARADAPGTVGNVYFHVPAALQPDLKFLCGDQVYLDAPWQHFLLKTHSEAELRTEFLETYLRGWSQAGPSMGFSELLRHGATYFSSDDHDLWNNAPNRSVIARDTWTEAGRERWHHSASELYQAFQTPKLVDTFAVGSLSFLVLDTRMERKEDRSAFMPDESMQALEAWVDGLQGPGVLVCGQPIFAERVGFKGRFTDWNLPNYAQYPDLVRRLTNSKHSIVILTGDVHFGRVATCQLPSGIELIEVISSPLSLVDKAVGGNWQQAPDYFPAIEIPGLTNMPVHTETYAVTTNHFVTIEFSAVGSAVSLAARAWPIAEGGTIEKSSVVFERRIR
jgi:hypothetical protein